METNGRLSRLSRYELVKLLYDLRKENLALQERCEKAEARVAELERSNNASDEMQGRLMALERLVLGMKDYRDDVSGQKKTE